MAIPKPKNDFKYTYADYLSWPDEERWELIDGVPYDMSPAPSVRHQEVLLNLSLEIGRFLDDKECSLFIAPFDVSLNEVENTNDEELYTVVQPDLVVVCDRKKLDGHGCVGVPDICIEILSPSTAYKDETQKMQLYEKYGVKEYWIINPDNETIMLYRHNRKFYEKPQFYNVQDTLESLILTGLQIKLCNVFKKK